MPGSGTTKMPDSLHARLDAAAGDDPPQPDMCAIAIRAGAMGRHRRAWRIAGGFLCLAVITAVGLAGIQQSRSDSDLVVVAPARPVTAAVPSSRLLVVRAGGIEVVEASDGSVTRAVDTTGFRDPVTDVTVAPDGRAAYLAMPVGPLCDPQLVRVDLATGNRTTIGSGRSPTTSPDGRTLAYLSHDDGCGAVSIVLRDLATGSERRLVADAFGTSAMSPSITLARFAADSHALVLVQYRRIAGSGVMILDPDRPIGTDNPHEATTTPTSTEPATFPSSLHSPVPLPDGTIAAVTSRCQPRATCTPNPPSDGVDRILLDGRTEPILPEGVIGRGDQGLIALFGDPSGTRLGAVDGRGDLHEVIDGHLRLITTGVSAASWLPATAV